MNGVRNVVRACVFAACYAGDGGAALSAEFTASIAVEDSDASGCSGSAAFALDSSRGTFANVRASGNRAPAAPALALSGASEGALMDCVLAANEATSGDGGAVAASEGSRLALSRTTVANNTAAGDGGAMRLTDGTSVVLSESSFERNVAQGDAGCFAMDAAGMVSDGTNRCVGNEAVTGNGGVTTLSNGANFTWVGGDVVSGNAADEGGGGVVWYDHQTVTLPYAAVRGESYTGGNRAFYGDVVASNPASIVATHAGFEMSAQYFLNPIVVTVYDALGQVVALVDADSADADYRDRVEIAPDWLNVSEPQPQRRSPRLHAKHCGAPPPKPWLK